VAVLNATVNQQLNQYQGGVTGRVKSTWWNKTLEAELWKVYMGVDLFNGQRTSYFGRIQPASAFFIEARASF